MKITIEAEPAEIKALIMELYPVQVYDDSWFEKAEKLLQDSPDLLNTASAQMSDV